MIFFYILLPVLDTLYRMFTISCYHFEQFIFEKILLHWRSEKRNEHTEEILRY